MANEVSKVAAEVKKAAVGSEAKKQQLYSRDALMPENVFDLLPYKETHEALKESDEDKLRELLCGFVVSIAKGVWDQSWDTINDKKEKKRILKALVYLDTLITLYRMPPQFEFAINELSQRFRGIEAEPLEVILQKFCSISVKERGEPERKRKGATTTSESQYKFMKSKE